MSSKKQVAIEVSPPGGRMFAVVAKGTKQPYEGQYFGQKAAAKELRDQLNGIKVGTLVKGKNPGDEDRIIANTDLNYLVTIGPDHRNFK